MEESRGSDVFDSSIDQSPLLIVEDASSSSNDSSCEMTFDATNPQHIPTWLNSYSSTKIYFNDLSGYFTTKFLCWLAIHNCFITGGSYTIVTTLSLPLFKDMEIDASLTQMYMCMINLPFSMKPVIGVASDLFPICGYNKRYTVLIGIFIGVVGCCSLLWVVPDTLNNAKEAEWIVLCFAAVSYQRAASSSSGEGKYSELMNLHPQSGSSIPSFNSGWYFVGCILVQSFVGPLCDKGYFHILYWIVLFLCLIPLVPTLLGWIPEKKRFKDDPGIVPVCSQFLLFDKGTFQSKRVAFLVISLCGLSAPSLAIITTYASVSSGICFAVVLIVLFCGATYFVFPKSFFWIVVSVVITKLSNINIGSALGYYYTASETCVPDGPNFNYTYYITMTGVLGSIMCLLTVIVYQSIFGNWKFRSVLIFTLLLETLASTVDLVIIKRWNISIGIPDKVFFSFGAAMFENITGTMYYIPSSAIYAKMSPPGMEAAGFAYVLGLSNFCNLVANIMGSEAIRLSGIKTIGEECNFDALSFLIIVTKIIIPIVIGIPAMFLIPNKLQTECLIDWEKEGWVNNDETERSDLLESGNEEPGEQDDQTAPLLDVLTGDSEQVDGSYQVLLKLTKPAPEEGRTHCGPWLMNPDEIKSMPKFPEGYNMSLLAKYLTKDVYDQLAGKKDSAGVSFETCIMSGCQNVDSGIGCYAGSHDSYTTFAPLFDQVIEQYHKHGKDSKHVSIMDATQLNCPPLPADEQAMIVSTRIRVGRNLAEFPLGPGLSNKQRNSIVEKVCKAFESYSGDLAGTFYALNKLNKKERNKLIADHFLFKEGDRFQQACGLNRDWPNSRGIFHNKEKTFLVWVNEEDHLRIISMEPGADIHSVFDSLSRGAAEIEKILNFAHDEHLGYITSCPTNLGTAMRASVHIKLPKLSKDWPKFQTIADLYYVQIRGIHGEHSKSADAVFDISNKRRLGRSEKDLVQDMYNGVKAMIAAEKSL